jgi:tungstate transport system substrate-binding protein
MKHRVVIAATCLMWLIDCRPPPRTRAIEIATTTSLQGSGLLDGLSEQFRADSGIEIHAFVIGSGQAMNLARQGMVDLAITHDPTLEGQFISETRPELYRQFMWNDFVIVGPRSDPARVRGARSAEEAFRRIHQTSARFCSRNDRSGTYAKELALWTAAPVSPSTNPNYMKLGQPMAQLLRSADEVRGYTLSDRATFDRLSGAVDLEVVDEGDPVLRNVYAITLMRPGRDHREAHADAARFAHWILSASGRRVVEAFRIAGRQEFFWIDDSRSPSVPSQPPRLHRR